jgi:hypothetical protein
MPLARPGTHIARRATSLPDVPPGALRAPALKPRRRA